MINKNHADIEQGKYFVYLWRLQNMLKFESFICLYVV